MAFPTGGRADKLGNSYEERWLVRQYLDLLNNKISSITVEAIGLDEEGVEFWVNHFDGTREAHQCKARNGMNEKWTIADLKSRKVLSRLGKQLDRSLTHKFMFVSAVPFISLNDLCEAARNSSDDPELYYHYLLDGVEKKELFHNFCKAIGKDVNNPVERALVFNYLKRSSFITNHDERSDLYNLVGFFLSGDPEMVVALLASYAINKDRLGNPIYADELYEYLKERDIYPRNLAYDNRIAPVLNTLKKQFEESISPVLIRGKLIEREETKKCVENLEENGLLIIYGEAGSGKSGVLFELTQIYQQKGIPYLPLRVDRQIPKHNPKFFGERLGLPDSPVYSLYAVSGERPALIVIDQIDAIRWTSIHSSDSFEVCKELVNQILFLRSQNKDIRVILSCRSFDMKNDRRLETWLSNVQHSNKHIWSTVEVKGLTEKSVQTIVGDDFNQFNPTQKILLSNIQNLFMWCELKNNGLISDFSTSIDLISEFIRFNKQKIEDEGISSTEIDDVLKVLTDHMENQSENSFPVYLVSSLSQRVIASLSSSGIVQEVNRKLSFSHQTYLDFLIAQRVIFEINSGNSIIEWLGAREKQSLFRREQLRHVLIMLSQDHMGRFIAISELILRDTSVRFHFKHLVLEVISSLPNIEQKVHSLIKNLLNEPYWKPHIIYSVINGNTLYVKELIRNGYLHQMLISSNTTDKEYAIGLLQSVNESLQDEIVALLKPLINQEEWFPYIQSVIGWNIENDTESMFNFRLRLMERGYYPHLINWKRLSQSHPLRAITVVRHILDGNDDQEIQRTRAQKINKHDLKSISKVIKKYPIEAWEMIIPIIIQSSENIETYELRRLNKEIGEQSPLATAVELAVIAANKIASSDSSTWAVKISALGNENSEIVDYIIARGMAHISKDFADMGIQWLLDDQSRLRVGNSIGEPSYLWSRFLIEKLAPHCNNSLYYELEYLLTYFHEPEELNKARRALQYRKKSEGSIYYPYWGVPQYLLLSKLPISRMTKSVKELLIVLKRSFSGRTDQELMGKIDFSGGWIGSSLDENLDRISDRAWLEIISNNKIPYESPFSKRDSKRGGGLIESSICQFSRSLEKVARQNPGRFVNLALQFPENVHPQYISAIINAIQLTKDNSDSQERNTTSWKAAPIDKVIEFINKFHNLEDRDMAISFCRLIRDRCDEVWSESILNKLGELARSHIDPLPNELSVYDVEWDGNIQNVKMDSLLNSSINCVRGAAAHAICLLLWKNGDLLEFFKKAIDTLVNDQHIVVRMAVVPALVPIINLDKDLAVRWFIKAAETDGRVALTSHGFRFISYTVRTHFSSLYPVIKAMIESENVDIVRGGAELVTGCWVLFGFCEEEINKCLDGSIDHKKGIVKFATGHLAEPEISEKCSSLLSRIIESDAEQLSEDITKMFRYGIKNNPQNIKLILQYLKSDAFTESSILISSLSEFDGDLLEFSEVIFSLFDAFVNYKKKRSSLSFQISYNIEESIDLLMRLYEQSKDQNIAVFNKCLDTWDLLLEERIGRAMFLQKQIHAN